MAIFKIELFEQLGTNIQQLAPIVAKWEGGFVADPIDKGGATNMGVTIGTWKLVGYDKNGDGKIDDKDIRLLTKNDFKYVLQKYWDKWRADEIKSQSVANILVDWYWMSGKWGIVIPQRDILKVVADGVVGPKTIAAINAMDPEVLFNAIKTARIKFYNDIVSKSVKDYEKKIGRKSTQAEQLKNTQMRFFRGWINRLNDIKYEK